MKKILVALAALVTTACHNESPYVFDIPKILTMDGKKIPEMLGTPDKTILPQGTQEEGGGEGIYHYVKQEYSISIFYNYKTGLIKSIQMTKIIPLSESAKIDVVKEKADLTTKLDLKNIDITNFQVDTIGVLQQPNSPILIHAGVYLAEPSEKTDSTNILMQPAPKQ